VPRDISQSGKPERAHSIVSQWQERQAAATTITTKVAETTTKIKELRVRSQSRDIVRNESMNESMNEPTNQ
jgi:hypothetical protein